MKVRLLLMAVLMLSSVPHYGARERMTLKVSPAVSFAPANLVVRTTIESDADNRSVEIIAESEDFYRSSQIELNGGDAPRTSQFEFRSLPQGTYEVKAILYGSSGEARAEVRQQVNVIASGAGN